MQYLYLIINLASISIPFVFSFHPKLNFYKNWIDFFKSNFIVSFVFILWDILYTNIGVWGFNSEYLIGVNFFKLPIEEYLFFLCIPYSCLFTWHCFEILIKRPLFTKIEKHISFFLILCSTIVAILNYDRLYTTVTFALLAISIFYFKYILKVKWLGKFYFTYLILIIPFLIVNGKLTGYGLDKPIVWYNDFENIGFRLLTIPIEDIFYGMLLILLHVFFYNYFKSDKVLLKKLAN